MTKTIKEIQEILARPISEDELKYRVQRTGVNKNGKNYAVLVPYISARTAITRLNEAFGLFGWQNDVEDFKTGVKSTLRIKNPETGEWVQKVDVGAESNVEKLKGSVSDALKRACVLLNVAIELYESGEVFGNECNKNDEGSIRCKTKSGDFFYVKPNIKAKKRSDQAIEDLKNGDPSQENISEIKDRLAQIEEIIETNLPNKEKFLKNLTKGKAAQIIENMRNSKVDQDKVNQRLIELAS